jgi:hypothetical protein
MRFRVDAVDSNESRHSGARAKRASPESITTAGIPGLRQVAHPGMTRWTNPVRNSGSASLIRLLFRFRRRRIDGARRLGTWRERGFVIAAPLNRRRPRPIDAFRLDGGDCKSVAGSLQGHRALPSQAIEVDHRGWTSRRRLPCGHHQRGALAIVRQRVGPQRQCDQRAVGK